MTKENTNKCIKAMKEAGNHVDDIVNSLPVLYEPWNNNMIFMFRMEHGVLVRVSYKAVPIFEDAWIVCGYNVTFLGVF